MHLVLAEARELFQGIRDGLDPDLTAEVLVCPAYQLLFPMAKAVAGTPILLGAQNVHEAAQGAFTGEVSAKMLSDTGCTHVIVGHSERRHVFGEVGPQLAKKVRAVCEAGMTVIYCVGETLDERDQGHTDSIVERQISEVLDADVRADRLIIAYEPVWAIGTGRTATPQQAQDVHALIRSRLEAVYDSGTAQAVRILYGGSVKPGNAQDLLGQPDIDGALVGGASLVAADFLAIIAAAGVAATASR